MTTLMGPAFRAARLNSVPYASSTSGYRAFRQASVL